ncbi:MAG: hypothetical protein KF773_24660 [Deltaproteobacteria bacterium]|nr:hypothetical protein [Deltaproteobacteria bacterium]
MDEMPTAVHRTGGRRERHVRSAVDCHEQHERLLLLVEVALVIEVVIGLTEIAIEPLLGVQIFDVVEIRGFAIGWRWWCPPLFDDFGSAAIRHAWAVHVRSLALRALRVDLSFDPLWIVEPSHRVVRQLSQLGFKLLKIVRSFGTAFCALDGVPDDRVRDSVATGRDQRGVKAPVYLVEAKRQAALRDA